LVKPDSTVESRAVTVGFEHENETVVESGLEPGQLVVTDGQFRLVPGAKVEVKNSDGAKQS
jgi:multidrug efflux system membrane fusion protein